VSFLLSQNYSPLLLVQGGKFAAQGFSCAVVAQLPFLGLFTPFETPFTWLVRHTLSLSLAALMVCADLPDIRVSLLPLFEVRF
jgi:hypothetical protein